MVSLSPKQELNVTTDNNAMKNVLNFKVFIFFVVNIIDGANLRKRIDL